MPAAARQISELDQVAAGAVPVGVAADQVWIARRPGELVALDLADGAPTTLLDLADRVVVEGEGGLIGLAIAPDGASVYLSYTDEERTLRVVSIALEEGRPVLGEPVDIVFEPMASALHPGGSLRFDSAGLLYVAIGDGSLPEQIDTQTDAQDTGDLSGSIIRIDPGGAHPYSIPADNPLAGDPDARGEIYAWGLRNPWGFAIDNGSGELWIGDVGEQCFEEIDVLGAGGGANFGWPALEGTLATGRLPEPGNHVLPIAEYGHSGPATAIVGGHVYRGDEFADLPGAFLFGDYGQGTVFWIRRDSGGGVVGGRLAVRIPFITGFVETSDHEVLVLTERSGIFRLVAP